MRLVFAGATRVVQQRIWTLLWLGWTTLAFATDDANVLTAFLEQTQSMQAEFVQTVRSSDNRVVEQSQGNVKIKKPGYFLWQVVKPYPHITIGSEDEIYFYDQDLQQVIIRGKDKALHATPAALLSGNRQARQYYHFGAAQAEGDLLWVQVKPHQESQLFESIKIAFKNKTLAHINLRDSLGQTTEITFNKVEQNIDLDEKIFEFDVPEMADVVRE